MSFNIADRVKETTTTTGTGSITLAGAVTGYVSFSSAIGNGNTCYYTIQTQTETEWEVGLGTVSAGVLSRDTVLASSNGGALVNFSAGTKYVFNTEPAIHLKSLVPYTGATASLNLGAYNITATQLIKVGGLATEFLKADGSVDSTTYMNRAVYDTDADGIVDAAMAMRTIGRNSTGATLYKGTVVYISGSTGSRPNFVKAQANSEATSAGTFGVVYADIANNSDGYVVTIGTIDTLDTRTTATNPFTSVTLADGDTVYLDPTTAGYITNVKPSAPNHLVYVGKVTRTSPTNGTIVYRIQNGAELDEIHDVAITSKANNDVLVYESSSSLWKNKSIATILGYTPANDSLVMHLAGTETATGYKTFSIGLQTTTGDNYLNYTSGATYIGYNAAPVGGYKLAVNGTALFANSIEVISATSSINLKGTTTNTGVKGIYFYQNNLSGWVKSTPSGGSDIGNLELGAFGANFMTASGTSLGPTKASMLIPLEGSEFMGNSVNSGSHYYSFNNSEKAVRIVSTRLGAYGRGDFKILVRTANTSTDAADSDAAIYIPGSNRNISINNGATDMGYALGVNGTFKATGLLQLSSYNSSSSVPGTVAGLLGFDASGNVITTTASGGISGSGTAGQVTYWTGSSAVGGSSTFTFDSTIDNLAVKTQNTASGSRGISSEQYSSSIQGAVITFKKARGTIATPANVNANDLVGLFSISARVGGAFTSDRCLFGANMATSTGMGMFFNTGSSDGIYAPCMYIQPSGNVQINPGGSIITGVTDSGYRLDVNGTGASTGALRVTGGNVQFGSSTGLNWDNTNGRLGIGTNAPESSVTINLATGVNNVAQGFYLKKGTGFFRASNGTGSLSNFDAFFEGLPNYDATGLTFAGRLFNTSSTNAAILFQSANAANSAGINTSQIIFGINNYLNRHLNFYASGNMIIQNGGTFTDAGYRLDIQGTLRATGQVRLSGLPTSSAGLSTGDLWNNLGIINIV